MMNRRQLLTALAGLSVGGLWLSGCSRNEPINPPTPLQSIQPRVSISRVWSQSIGRMGRRDVPGLCIREDQDVIYAAAGNGGVAALHLDGGLLWQVSLPAPLVCGPVLATSTDDLWVGSARGDLWCLHRQTGDVQWHKAMESEVLAITATADHLFVRTADGRLTALAPKKDEPVWVLDHDMPALSVRGMSAAIPLANGLLIGWEDGSVETILQDNGERAWEARIALPRGRTDIERMIDVQASLVHVDGRLFAAATNAKVTALDVQTGSQLWVSDVSTWVDMAFAQQRLFVVGEDDTVRALAADSGRILWKQDALRYRRLSKAVAWQRWLMVADAQGIMHVLDANDGQLIGRVESAVSTALVDAHVLVDGRLLTLDVEGNLSLWQAATESE